MANTRQFIAAKSAWVTRGIGEEFPLSAVEFVGAIVSRANGDLVLKYTEESLLEAGVEIGTLRLIGGTANARVLAVGGGGGGGVVCAQSGGGGAGGGAGGFVEVSNLLFSNAGEYQIAVGAGGKGAVPTSTTSKIWGSDGGTTTLKLNGADVVTPAIGGGGGGANSAGRKGGSGGGGSRSTSKLSGDYNRKGGTGVEGQGHDGGVGGVDIGTSYPAFRGAGGGGAGGKGYDAVFKNERNIAVGAPAGGIGRECDITGVALYYAGGGGGAYVNAASGAKYPRGLGGLGGGGHGAGGDGEPGRTDTPPEGYRFVLGADSDYYPAEDGANGFGGGGGGGAEKAGSVVRAGNGGSGVLIIRLSGFVPQ